MDGVDGAACAAPLWPRGDLDEALGGVAGAEDPGHGHRIGVGWAAERANYRGGGGEEGGGPGEPDQAQGRWAQVRQGDDIPVNIR